MNTVTIVAMSAAVVGSQDRYESGGGKTRPQIFNGTIKEEKRISTTHSIPLLSSSSPTKLVNPRSIKGIIMPPLREIGMRLIGTVL
jgi:hypothetical protein